MSEEKTEATQEKTKFRGFAVHCSEDGKLKVELIGITPLELYGALITILKRTEQDNKI